jgi:hypothetical protein
MNPYDWKRNQPSVEVPRREALPLAEELRRGGSGVLLAGRGMGKSVFLQQVQRELERLPDTRVVLFDEPPAELSVGACLETLARGLDVTVPGPLSAREVIDAFRARADAGEHLVLLYDELDRYAKAPSPGAEPPGRHFFNSLESMRRNVPGVGILAAGSIGVFAFRDALGSSFLARADKVRIGPFDRAAIATLARPFADRAAALTEATIEALYLASGGNPALVTYGLGALWDEESPSEYSVAAAFVRFQEKYREFLRDFQLAFADPRLSEAPQRVWELVRESDGEVRQEHLEKACGLPRGILRLDPTDVLDILEAAGLVRVTGSAQADPVLVRPVASLLNLPSASPSVPQPRERLARDLETLLRRLHVVSSDFFRPGTGGQGKQLVPESVFAAILALGLELLGWQVEREALQAAGRTDLKLRWNGGVDVAVVEVKIWGRTGYKEVSRQLAGYWSADTVAGAVVMITDGDLADWPERYRRECLGDPDLEPRREAGSGGVERWRSTSRTAQGWDMEVDHFLLRLTRGR